MAGVCHCFLDRNVGKMMGRNGGGLMVMERSGGRKRGMHERMMNRAVVSDVGRGFSFQV